MSDMESATFALISRAISFTYLALGQLWLDRGPCLTLSSVTEQVHNDSAFRDSFVNLEKVGSRNPAVLLSFLPRGTILPNTDNDVQAVVSKVETLTMPLRSVTNERKCVIFEVFLQWQSD